MPTYSSNKELFEDALALIERIDVSNHDASKVLRDGFGALNGLTDGWAHFMDSIKDVIQTHRPDLPECDITDLERLLTIVDKIVTRS